MSGTIRNPLADVRFLPKWTEQQEPGGVKLDQAEIVAGEAVEVEPPSDPLVELLRAVDIRNGDDDDLELHVNSRDARLRGFVDLDFIGHICHVLSSLRSIESSG
jgi:hypothetical protein